MAHEIEFPIRDLDQWHDFAAVNKDALLEIYPTLDDAMNAAAQGGIMIGGGAAPLFHVYFVDGAQ